MPLSIAYKELFPVVLAASLCGHQWSAKQVEFCSDNTAVVEVLRSDTSRDSNLMVLLRHLSLLVARHSFAFTARHVPGKSNGIVEASGYSRHPFSNITVVNSKIPLYWLLGLRMNEDTYSLYKLLISFLKSATEHKVQ